MSWSEDTYNHVRLGVLKLREIECQQVTGDDGRPLEVERGDIFVAGCRFTEAQTRSKQVLISKLHQ